MPMPLLTLAMAYLGHRALLVDTLAESGALMACKKKQYKYKCELHRWPVHGSTAYCFTN